MQTRVGPENCLRRNNLGYGEGPQIEVVYHANQEANGDEVGLSEVQSGAAAHDPLVAQEQLFPFVVGTPCAAAAFIRCVMGLPAGQTLVNTGPVVAGMASIAAISKLPASTCAIGGKGAAVGTPATNVSAAEIEADDVSAPPLFCAGGDGSVSEASSESHLADEAEGHVTAAGFETVADFDEVFGAVPCDLTGADCALQQGADHHGNAGSELL